MVIVFKSPVRKLTKWTATLWLRKHYVCVIYMDDAMRREGVFVAMSVRDTKPGSLFRAAHKAARAKPVIR